MAFYEKALKDFSGKGKCPISNYLVDLEAIIAKGQYGGYLAYHQMDRLSMEQFIVDFVDIHFNSKIDEKEDNYIGII